MAFQLVDDDLPLLTEVVGDTAADDLPVLTEIVDAPTPEIQPADMPNAPTAPPGATLSGDEMVRLLQQLEAHLETVFTSKLNSQLEHLQRLAVDLAISEFKAELPQLLHDALIKKNVNRQP